MATKKSSSKKTTNKRTHSGATQRPAKRKKVVSLAQYEAEAQAQHGGGADTAAPEAAPAPEVGAGSKDPAGADQAPKEKKQGGLEAAVRVLAETGTPMTTGDMVKVMLEKGYWQTSGKTPAATMYSAILREINLKGDKSRFRKTERGKFELTEAGKAGE